MKLLSAILLPAIVLVACQETEKTSKDLTGNESTYPLLQASNYAVDGTVTFKEKADGSTLIVVALSGTEGSIKHPVHLHAGNVSEPDADVAALLNPVTGSTGISETHFTMMADETPVSYRQLIALNASVKIHLSDVGEAKNTILAAGNIGIASADDLASGRTGIAACKSE